MADQYRVHLAPRAYSDLARIFDFIARHSVENAARFVGKILDRIDALATMPASYRCVGRTRPKRLPVYTIVVRPYVVYYSVESNTRSVFVMTIRHGGRRKPRRF